TLDPADRAEVEHLVLELEKLQPRRRRPRQSTNSGRGRQQPPLVDVELFSDAAEQESPVEVEGSEKRQHRAGPSFGWSYIVQVTPQRRAWSGQPLSHQRRRAPRTC